LSLAYIRSEGKAKRLGSQLLAIAVDTEQGRKYLPADDEQEALARGATPAWAPETDLPEHALGFRVQGYGMTKHRDLFTARQLLALTTFSSLIAKAHQQCLKDAISAGMEDDGVRLESAGSSATAYADAIAIYLAMLLDRMVCYNSSFCMWLSAGEFISNIYVRHSMSMVWDYAEANPLSNSTGGWGSALDWVCRALNSAKPAAPITVNMRDAREGAQLRGCLVSTDPPYYDNVPYADLSDLFYVWLRGTLAQISPDLFSTLLVPKTGELVADPHRFGNDRIRAREFFEDGLQEAFASIRRTAAVDLPITIYYAFKQTDSQDDMNDEGFNDRSGQASIGWEAMLTALIGAGLMITATWPLRTERPIRPRSISSNALASCILLVCRPRSEHAPVCSRSDFLSELRAGLPAAVASLRLANIAATDLQQAALGPGMAVFSKYSSILDVNDQPVTIRSALAMINSELMQILLGDIADVDAETQFALGWFDRFGYEAGRYGEADLLLRSRNANAGALKATGVLELDAGIVQLRDPRSVGTLLNATDAAAPAWSQMIALIAALVNEEGGEDRAGAVLRIIGLDNADRLKSIAYHCYLVSDERKRTTQARDFNTLIAAWPEIERRAADAAPRQDMFE